MSSLALALLAVLVLPVAVARIVLPWRAYRKSVVASRRVRLASECFSGLRQVAVAPAAWRLPVADIRLLAAQRGYQEVSPPAPDVVAFQRAPDAGPPVPHPPSPQGRERLAAELAESDFAWAKLSELGGGPADATAVAGQLGSRILRSYGNVLDPVLLVGKRSIGSVRDVLPPGRKPLTSAQRNVGKVVAAVPVVAAAALLGALAARKLPGDWWVFALVAVLVAVAVLPYAVFAGTGSTTKRMTRLVQEFDGRVRVPIIWAHFRLDQLVFLDVAAELGYVYSAENSLRTMSRWYEAWTIFEPARQEARR